MNREEFFQKAVIELSAAVTPVGAWKIQIDKAIEMADYLTTKVYGERNAKDGFTQTLPL